MYRLKMSQTVTGLERLKAEMDHADGIVKYFESQVCEADGYAARYPDDFGIEVWLSESTCQLEAAKAVYSAAEAAYRKADQTHTDWVEEMTYAACEVDDGELQ